MIAQSKLSRQHTDGEFVLWKALMGAVEMRDLLDELSPEKAMAMPSITPVFIPYGTRRCFFPNHALPHSTTFLFPLSFYSFYLPEAQIHSSARQSIAESSQKI